MALNAKTNALVNETTPYSGGVEDLARQIEAMEKPGYAHMARALRRVQASLNGIQSAIRQQSSVPEITVTDDETGELVAWFGSQEVDGVRYKNYLKEVYIGGDDPPTAVVFTDEFGNTYVGENGSISVLDAFGAQAARLGTWYDTLPITGAANNGSGAIRLTVVGHTLNTGDTAEVRSVGGVPNATGSWVVTSIDADHVDLQDSYFDGTYTSGGAIWRVLKVTSAANNGSGRIRLLTAVAHGYTNGDKVDVEAGGVDSQFVIEVIDSTHFDLVGSTWAGDASGGSCLRYFGGGLFQTIAVASSTGEWDDAKLRAQPNGDLLITDAVILLNGSGATIELDPDDGEIVITATGGSPARQVWLHNGQIDLRYDDGTGGYSTYTPGQILQYYDATNLYGDVLGAGLQSWRGMTTNALAAIVDLWGYTDTTVCGPVVAFHQSRGSGAAPTQTANADRLGGFFFFGTDDSGPENDFPSAITAKATENHTSGAHGAELYFYVTPNGSAVRTLSMTLGQDGTLDVLTGLKINGTQVVTSRQADPGTAASSPSTSAATVGGTFGAAWTATEQSIANQLKTQFNTAMTDIANLKTQINNLITDRNRIRTTLQAHGLMA